MRKQQSYPLLRPNNVFLYYEHIIYRLTTFTIMETTTKQLLENTMKQKHSSIFSTFDKHYEELPRHVLKNIVFPSQNIDTPFGNKPVLYADFIASGKPCPKIENYISRNIYTKYSNTHSNNHNGICMKNEIHDVRDIVKREYNLDDNYEILFKGSGVTDCINYLVNCLDYEQYNQTHIFITSYEHYSNHLPWVELAKKNKHVKLHIIPLNKYAVDLVWFHDKLHDIVASSHKKEKMLIITSVIHCSNMTGYFTPVEEMKRMMDDVRTPNVATYFFCDVACSAPYIKRDFSCVDAFFVSPHKFIGGVETPGLLVAKTCLFQKSHALNPGGSCVKRTHKNNVVYADDIEVRESAGTPNIIGIIKIGQCLALKNVFNPLIEHNEQCLSSLVEKWHHYFASKNRNYKFIDYESGGREVHKLPIVLFHMKNLHYNFVVVLLNDLFGIQTRGGKMCSGLFNDALKEKHGWEGFCRVSLHWTMSKRDVHYIFNAIKFVVKYGERFLDNYVYDENQNLFFWKMQQQKM